MGNLSNHAKNIALWLLILIGFVYLWQAMAGKEKERDLSYSEFKSEIKGKKVSGIVISPDIITGKIINQDGSSSKFKVTPVPDTKLVEDLEEFGIDYKGQPKKGWLFELLVSMIPWIFLLGLWWFLFFRGSSVGGKQIFSFGRSRARLQSNKKDKVTFSDVAGVVEAKEELQEVIEFLKDPAKFQKLGGKIPKGVLLVGPAGTGKTLLAKAVAGEAGVHFFSSSGSEFVEMFVGVGASRVRDLFEMGRKNAPCVLFIDEIDAVGRHRGAGYGGGHDEREQTLNQLLVEMDGFDTKEGVILLAATNRPDVLDSALLRSGRFDRHIVVPVPDIKGREEILKVHAKDIKCSKDCDLSIIAKRTPGFVGADLANLINEAALLSARRGKESVDMPELEEAIDRVLAGPERRSRKISDKEKKIIAYHEAGHALVAKLMPNTEPVHKISIIPRGVALGYTVQLPTEDKYLVTKSEMISKIAVLLGGRFAEKLVFKDITTGAENDLREATALVQNMICLYGMSDKIGQVSLRKREEEVFLGRDIFDREKIYSEKTAEEIDSETRSFIEGSFRTAGEILVKNRNTLDKLADRLIEKEVLDGDELADLLNGKAPRGAAQKENQDEQKKD
ncbi:MAG: ATP-dependent zinc metalloprotease FtsH [Elusimicrobia bacterium ADurb.Bin231]|nr:MAG: ATP-dependent zinc metalloprotease FtsH [Elusimicrobia bacterium ADurb.Bin231]